MDEKEQILNNIEKFKWFLIPSRRSIFSIGCDITTLTTKAKELVREGLIDWMVSFDGNSSAILLGKPKDYEYSLTEIEKKKILDKITKLGYYNLGDRKTSKIKNWSDRLYFLKTLVKEGKLDWHIDFQKKKYLFRKI